MEKKDGPGPKREVEDPSTGVPTAPAGAIRGQKENPSGKNGITRRSQAPRDIPSKGPKSSTRMPETGVSSLAGFRAGVSH